MRFEGKLTRDGRFWLAEIPLLDGLTQGRTRKEAFAMIADWLETMVDRPGFRARVHPRDKNEFEVSGSDAAAMTALLLRRLRQASGTSLAEVASRLGAASRNAYARYERGDAVPSVEKLDALVKAASPGEELVITVGGYRRNLLLPRALQGRPVLSAIRTAFCASILSGRASAGTVV